MFRRAPSSVKGMRFKENTNVLGRALPREQVKFLKEGGFGADRMIMNKLSFFHFTGGVFGLFALFKAGTLALGANDSAQKYADFLYQKALESDPNAPRISKESLSFYQRYIINPYTITDIASIPLLFVLGSVFSSSYGTLRAFYLLTGVLGAT